ncbi:hypothetical protein [Actinomadura rayongensis]|uniref:Uncharacterized protein n=1 Tax=Actinomadura rayongensis TaxID=1429076 RepID=A0A6I4WBG5_9ACTN|nr:hypothetical protein [Actinomadura rayongensis]MXQ65366.1 hypothetical protein [Actinomadura rayongensis]
MTTDLDALVRSIAAATDTDPAVGDDARRALRDAVTATDPHARPARRSVWRPLQRSGPQAVRRSLRWKLGVPLAVGLAGAAAAALTIPGGDGPRTTGTQIHARQVAALTFTEHGRYIDVRIKDPLADPARYRAEFAARGMDVRLTLVPASPSIVGTVVFSEGPEFPLLTGGGCVTGGGGPCVRGFRVPVGFRGTATLSFGRAARPGERYDSTANAFAPGEALHCLDVRGLTIDAALPRMAKRHVTAPLFHVEQHTTPGIARNVPRDQVPGSWYVADADPWAPGQVLLWVRQDRPEPRSAAREAALNRGCGR